MRAFFSDNIIFVHLVEIPEEEQLPSAGSGASYVAKKVAVVVPENSVKA